MAASQFYGSATGTELRHRIGQQSDPYGLNSLNADGRNAFSSHSPPQSASQNSSSTASHTFPGPKFKTIRDLENHALDKNQAESLKLLKRSLRERDRILAAPQDYFYRHILIPKLLCAWTVEMFFTTTILLMWTFFAFVADVMYAHFHFRTHRGFFTDLGHVLRLHGIFRWKIVLGCFLLSVASTWRYLRSMRTPPPVFHSEIQKAREFRRLATLSGPWILVGISFLCLFPTFISAPTAVEVIDVNISNASQDFPIGESADSVLFDTVIWEIIMKVALPMIFGTLVICAANLAFFWKGCFSIGVLQSTTPINWLTLSGYIRNPVELFQDLKLNAFNVWRSKVEPLFALPGREFVVIASVLFFLPVLFPLRETFRVWMYYHFLSFALLHAWKYNLETMRKSMTKAHHFGNMDFADVVALPNIAKELRRTGWSWNEYFEMHLRAGIQMQLRRTPNVLMDYFNVRMTTRDLNQLDSFVRFWLQPLKDYLEILGNTTTWIMPEEAHWGMLLDFFRWSNRRLWMIFRLYNPVNEDMFEEYFDGSGFATVVSPSVICGDSVKIISRVLLRGRDLDSRNVLLHYFSPVIEHFAQLHLALERVEQKFNETGVKETFDLYFASVEPTVKFYLRAHRGLKTILALHLKELLKVVKDNAIELHLDAPGMKFLVDKLSRNFEENA